jgi:ketosteroid isomerase-like protein
MIRADDESESRVPEEPPAASIVDQVRAALESDDPSQFRELLHPDVRWGAPGDPSPSCQNRDQVLTWYRQGREAGIRARVAAADVRGDKILVALTVTGSRAGESVGGESERWQVLTVRDGQIADIRACERRADAEALVATPDGR